MFNMKTLSLFYILSLSFVLVACSKDKFETTPRIEIKGYNSREIPEPPPGFDTELVVTLNFFDKQGDIGEGTLYAERKRLNTIGQPQPGNGRPDSYTQPIPAFTNKDQGEIIFRLRYDDLKDNLLVQDTIQFRFAVTDRANNTSDTITTEQIVILR
jgi:hypothetical protein